MSSPTTLAPTSRLHFGRLLVAEIEQAEACRVRLNGESWWDTRPMLDEREQCPYCIDHNTANLDQALLLGVITRHTDPGLSYLVHVLPESEWR